MKLRVFVYRLVAALTAFVFGVGIFNAWQYFQTERKTVAAITFLPPIKPEVVFATPAAEPLSPAVADSEEDAKEDAKQEDSYSRFDAEGYYYISDDKLPKAFRDFDMMHITTRNYENAAEENDYEDTLIAPEGFLRTKSVYDFTRINISEKQLAFETEKLDGVSYKFSGKFIEKGLFWNLESRTPVLKGSLIKLLKGKKIAESKVSFMWYGGC